MLKVDFDFSGLEAQLDALQDEINGHLPEAVAAGAAELYKEAKLRCPVSEKDHVFHGTHGKYSFRSGTLRDSIYRTLSKDNSSATKITYHIAWNHQKAPYGFMVEFGTSKRAAHPFMRPAFDARQDSALRTVKTVLESRIGAKFT